MAPLHALGTHAPSWPVARSSSGMRPSAVALPGTTGTNSNATRSPRTPSPAGLDSRDSNPYRADAGHQSPRLRESAYPVSPEPESGYSRK